MDIVMPVMGGVDAAREIKQIQPNAKVIYCSGYDKDGALPDDIARENEAAVLSKPYDINALAKMIREKLNRRKGDFRLK